jgi:WD40 repeat protein
MRSENNSNDGFDEDDGTVDSTTKWKDCESALKVEDEEGFEEDVKLMEELFVDMPNKRYQRLLAVIESHEAPVNCVRWNSVGTLFASAADDGTVVLQEYFGEMSAASMSDFQKYQFNTDASQSGTNRGFGLPSGNSEENKAETDKKDENSTYEKWRCKRSWNVHKGGVSDLAWSPDNIHLGTCGTDSTVIIWNINETSKR